MRVPSGSYTPVSGSGTSVRYNGINTSTSVVDLFGPTYTGNLVLVFNANTVISGADQIGKLRSVESEFDTMQLAVVGESGHTLPDIYPIDIQLQPGDGFTDGSHRPDMSRPRTPSFGRSTYR